MAVLFLKMKKIITKCSKSKNGKHAWKPVNIFLERCLLCGIEAQAV